MELQERSLAQEREFALRRELTRQIDELEHAYNELKDEFDSKLDQEKDVIRQVLHYQIIDVPDNVILENRNRIRTTS